MLTFNDILAIERIDPSGVFLCGTKCVAGPVLRHLMACGEGVIRGLRNTSASRARSVFLQVTRWQVSS